MAKLALKPDDVVEQAFYEVSIHLKRKIEKEYGTDTLATMSFSAPIGYEDASGANFTEALLALRRSFEKAYGPVVPTVAKVGTPDPDVEAPLAVDAPTFA